MPDLDSLAMDDGRRVRQAGETRSAQLESLRAVAALGVLGCHATLRFAAYHMAGPLHRIVDTGAFGVFLFFALSGFLLYRPFARRYVQGLDRIDLWRYALNRVLRILPLYYFVMISLLLTVATPGERAHWWRYLLLIQEFFPDSTNSLDGPAWSLAVEVQFYATLPLVAAGVAWASRRRLDLAVLLLLLLGTASMALRLYTVRLHPSDWTMVWQHSYPGTFVFFVPGMVLALLHTAWQVGAPARLRPVLSRPSLWLLAGAAAWCGVAAGIVPEFLALVATFLTIGSCTLASGRGALVRVLEWRPLALLGIASYSLYLWHYPLIQRLPATASRGRFEVSVELAMATAICCLVAALSYGLIEAPWLRLRRQWGVTLAKDDRRMLRPQVEVPAG